MEPRETVKLSLLQGKMMASNLIRTKINYKVMQKSKMMIWRRLNQNQVRMMKSHSASLMKKGRMKMKS